MQHIRLNMMYKIYLMHMKQTQVEEKYCYECGKELGTDDFYCICRPCWYLGTC